MALSSNGDVYVWGENTKGQLGINLPKVGTAALEDDDQLHELNSKFKR